MSDFQRQVISDVVCQITRDAICRKCGKSGHFAKVCKTKQFTTGKVNSLNQYFEEESDQEIFTLSGKDDAIISIEIEGQNDSIALFDR
jgi:hypothetical protein